MTQQTSQIKLIDAFNVSRFKGTYYLVGFKAQPDKDGNPFWKITVSDASGSLDMFCRDEGLIYSELAPQSLVDIEVRIEMLGVRPHFRCKFIQASTKTIGNPISLQQLPSSLCPIPGAVNALVELIDNINTDSLHTFVTQVLLQSRTGINFIQCPASLNYHHNYQGGLLFHSLEVATSFLQNQSLKQIEKDLGVVAALLHDIGKTQTLTPALNRTDKGALVDHNQLTLQLCAAPLEELSKKHTGHANHLCHMWTCASDGARYGFTAKTSLAKLLRKYDRASAFMLEQKYAS
jgi:3'-5' exoribonuclease